MRRIGIAVAALAIVVSACGGPSWEEYKACYDAHGGQSDNIEVKQLAVDACAHLRPDTPEAP